MKASTVLVKWLFGRNKNNSLTLSQFKYIGVHAVGAKRLCIAILLFYL